VSPKLKNLIYKEHMTYQASINHSFDVKLAAQLKSIELAILVHHFQYWINKNQKLDRNFKDGRTWTYQTREEIAANFPYFTKDQVRRYTDKLVKLKILKKGNYNKLKMDKTTWYSFENEEMFTIGRFANSMGESANRDDEFAKAIPKSIPKSLPDSIDLGLETEPIHKKEDKTLDASRRWKLTIPQTEDFEVIKSLSLKVEDKKIAFWVKNYPLKRILDAFNEATHYKPRSMSQYMSSLLDNNKVLPNANSEANIQFAKDFIQANKWNEPKIYKKYIKIPFGQDYFEIDFNMESIDFINRLLEKYEKTQEKL